MTDAVKLNPYLAVIQGKQLFGSEKELLDQNRAQGLRWKYNSVEYKEFSNKYQQMNWKGTWSASVILRAAGSACTQAIHHLGLALLAAVRSQGPLLKVNAYLMGRNIQKLSGCMAAIFHKPYGVYQIEKSEFHQKCYGVIAADIQSGLDIEKAEKQWASYSDVEKKAKLASFQQSNFSKVPTGFLGFLNYRTLSSENLKNLFPLNTSAEKESTLARWVYLHDRFPNSFKIIGETFEADLIQLGIPNRCLVSLMKWGIGEESIQNFFIGAGEKRPIESLPLLDYEKMTTEDFFTLFSLDTDQNRQRSSEALGYLHDTSIKKFFTVIAQMGDDLFMEHVVPERCLNSLVEQGVVTSSTLPFSPLNNENLSIRGFSRKLEILTDENYRKFMSGLDVGAFVRLPVDTRRLDLLPFDRIIASARPMLIFEHLFGLDWNINPVHVEQKLNALSHDNLNKVMDVLKNNSEFLKIFPPSLSAFLDFSQMLKQDFWNLFLLDSEKGKAIYDQLTQSQQDQLASQFDMKLLHLTLSRKFGEVDFSNWNKSEIDSYFLTQNKEEKKARFSSLSLQNILLLLNKVRKTTRYNVVDFPPLTFKQVQEINGSITQDDLSCLFGPRLSYELSYPESFSYLTPAQLDLIFDQLPVCYYSYISLEQLNGIHFTKERVSKLRIQDLQSNIVDDFFVSTNEKARALVSLLSDMQKEALDRSCTNDKWWRAAA